jgi:hypothetical protein
MTDLLSHLVDAPVANILILAGLAFLTVGVLGKISGKIEPAASGRVMSGLLGAALLIYGICAHTSADAVRRSAQRSSETQPSQYQHLRGPSAANVGQTARRHHGSRK